MLILMMLQVVGWGRTENQNVSEVLRMANVGIISQQQCKDSDEGFDSILTSNYFCAGSEKLGS
jgi:hypothetical protein